LRLTNDLFQDQYFFTKQRWSFLAPRCAIIAQSDADKLPVSDSARILTDFWRVLSAFHQVRALLAVLLAVKRHFFNEKSFKNGCDQRAFLLHSTGLTVGPVSLTTRPFRSAKSSLVTSGIVRNEESVCFRL
jgi:hypothetical protein